MRSMEQKKVVAVVVTYNRKELLKECLLALKSQPYENLQILVVDNFSNDGTNDYIASLIDNEKVVYFNTGDNLGGAGGFNIGIKKALQLGCDYVWVMDDDCIVKNNSLSALIDYANQINDQFGFLSSVVEWSDGSICKMNVQRKSVSKKVENFKVSQKIKLASFVSLFLKAEVVEDVGLPIKEFFVWGDDWEYTYRISKKYDSFLVPESVVIHNCKQNIGVDISKDAPDRLQRYFYAYRNEGFFYRKIRCGFWFWLKRMLHFKRILFAKCSHKKERLKILKQGVKAAKKFNPKIEYAYRDNKQLEILEAAAEAFSYGGQEAFLISMYKNWSTRHRYTFFTPFFCDNQNLIKLTEERNDKIISYNYKFNSLLRKKYIKKATQDLLRKHHYDVMHIHSGSVYALYLMAKLAKKHGVKRVIVHSHATGKMNFKYKLIKHFSDKHIAKFADEFFACSGLAAEWKFPKNIIENKSYQVIKNGITTEKFVFDSQIRDEYRKKFNITDEFVLCNVGRFEFQKNHEFIVEIARLLNERNFNFKFILVGDGILKNEIVKKINDLMLSDKFSFLEKRNDIPQIMMASDLFVLPSLYEGLPVVLVEAQATGLGVIVSDTVTKEIEITNLIKFLPITNESVWVDEIIKYKNDADRSKYADYIKSAGYDAKTSAKLLENIYSGCYNK